MNHNFRLITLIVVLVITAFTVVFGITASAAADEKTHLTSSKQTIYILKNFEGNPAVFEGDSQTPLYILDIYTSQLPERDIKRLEDGIKAESLEEILSIAEDYE